MLRRALGVLSLGVLLFPLSVTAQTTRVGAATAERVEIRSVLVRGGAARGAPGLPVAVDAVQAAIAAGTWTPPTADETWAVLASGPDGNFSDRRLAGGYAYAEVESDAERVMLLRAAGHAMVYVNGSPRAGDVYSHGYLALPVKLRAGKNTLLFAGGRGQLRAVLEPVGAEPFVLRDDPMLPDRVEGQAGELLASVVVVNPTELVQEVEVLAGPQAASLVAQDRARVAPMSVGRVPVKVAAAEGNELVVSLSGREVRFPLRVRKPEQSRRVTFVSEIDGSVQYYALVPAMQKDAALVLSLHGASVEATSQADAYAPKSWAHLVCPTNRRPFGFDWEDWGRLDALEVLAHAKAQLAHDPSRVYLTGHSMGGHGTWHLAANHPGMFAAAAPSAGWIAFSTYSPARATTRTTQPATSPADLSRAAFRAASLPSDTFSLLPNLADTGLFILHGDADDNVPVAQARTMAEQLKGFHKDWRLLEQPGAGHWWDDNESEPGASCVDHPGIFDLFARRRLPGVEEVRGVKFVTANPAVHSRLGWAEVVQQITPGQISSVDLRVDPVSGRIEGTTANVATLRLHGPANLKEVKLEGQTLAVSAGVTLRRVGDGWEVGKEVPLAEKNPRRAGPLKLALQNRMVFVYPTRGTPEENAAAFDLARYHAETWHYRAAGSVELVPDTDVRLDTDADRTVVLYGNADTNARWSRELAGSPIVVSRGGVRVGERSHDGDLSALFCRPRPGSEKAMVVVIGSSSPRAARAHARMPVFASGIAFPDFTVISADSLEVGAGAVLEAGFFGNDWGLSR
jgi:poly(3-hydroxybutyrate) depolymerase